jgi:hypothetical protein
MSIGKCFSAWHHWIIHYTSLGVVDNAGVLIVDMASFNRGTAYLYGNTSKPLYDWFQMTTTYPNAVTCIK